MSKFGVLIRDFVSLVNSMVVVQYDLVLLSTKVPRYCTRGRHSLYIQFSPGQAGRIPSCRETS